MRTAATSARHRDLDTPLRSVTTWAPTRRRPRAARSPRPTVSASGMDSARLVHSGASCASRGGRGARPTNSAESAFASRAATPGEHPGAAGDGQHRSDRRCHRDHTGRGPDRHARQSPDHRRLTRDRASSDPDELPGRSTPAPARSRVRRCARRSTSSNGNASRTLLDEVVVSVVRRHQPRTTGSRTKPTATPYTSGADLPAPSTLTRYLAGVAEACWGLHAPNVFLENGAPGCITTWAPIPSTRRPSATRRTNWSCTTRQVSGSSRNSSSRPRSASPKESHRRAGSSSSRTTPIPPATATAATRTT